MATQTQNLELFKQDGTEYPSLNMLNINMDKIDEAIGAIGNKGSLQSQIDTLGESVNKITFTGNAKNIDFNNWGTDSVQLMFEMTNGNRYFLGLQAGGINYSRQRPGESSATQLWSK